MKSSIFESKGFNASDIDSLAPSGCFNHQVTQHPVEGVGAIQVTFARQFAAAEMTCFVEAIGKLEVITRWNGAIPWASADAGSSRCATEA